MNDIETVIAHAEVLAGELLDALGERDRARDVAVRLEQGVAHLTAGLREIAGLCDTFRSPYTCKSEGQNRDDLGGSNGWCDQCIAMDTLGEI